jgi:diaminopimelate epimerase
MVAAGNDFVIIDYRKPVTGIGKLPEFSRRICDRKFGAGADGLLLLEKSAGADFRMRIFNSDGSEAEMCGNGSRCFALYAARLMKKKNADLKIQALAGLLRARVRGDQVKVNLTPPKDLKMDIPLTVEGRKLTVNFVNTGVPHAVVFAHGLRALEIVSLGRKIRNHKTFAPKGTNVNFVEITGENLVSVRTYERGVEDETLACGTGSVASALITGYTKYINLSVRPRGPVHESYGVMTRSGEVLRVYFTIDGGKLSDVWLEGKAAVIYKGVYYV